MTTQAEAPVTESVDPKKISQDIIELTGLSLEQLGELPQATRYRDVSGGTWVKGGHAPGLPEMHLVGIFPDGEDVAIYAAPTSPKSSKGDPLTPTRFTLNRRAASLLVEQMSWDTFKEEIADELIAQFEERAEDDEEDELEVAPGTGAAPAAPVPAVTPSATV